MGHGHTCCGGWNPRQGTIIIGIITLVTCFLWIGWEAYNIVWIEKAIDQSNDLCSPNPCERGGLCIASEKRDNSLGYVCDCSGTGYTGYHCNITARELGIKRTCGDYHREGYRQNGTYMMDFDGHNPESDDVDFNPFVTTCNFTDTQAFTIIKHSQHRRIEGGDDDAGTSFDYEDHVYKFYYEVNREIIADMMDKSSMSCYQTFTFECKNAKLNLRDDSDDDGKLNKSSYLTYGDYDPDEETKIDLSGTKYTLNDFEPEPQCMCAVTGTCPPTSSSESFTHKCNCDRGDSVWRKDEITLTTEDSFLNDKFPVLSANIIDAGDTTEEEFYITLSPVICYEDFEYQQIVNKDRIIVTSHMRVGLRVIWGVMIAMMVITCLMFICAIIMLVGVTYEACHALLPWMVIILIFDIMLFIAVIIRWFYLGYLFVAIEVSISAMWLIATIYSMIVVGMQYSDCLNTKVMHM